MLRLLVSARRLSSVSSLASACQLPDTSSSIANSVPRLAMRLSLILPPRLADDAGQLVDHPRAVAADRRNGQVLLHLWVAVVRVPAVARGRVYRERAASATFPRGADALERLPRRELRLVTSRAPPASTLQKSHVFRQPGCHRHPHARRRRRRLSTPGRGCSIFTLAHGTSGIVVGGTTGRVGHAARCGAARADACAPASSCAAGSRVIAGAGTQQHRGHRGAGALAVASCRSMRCWW